MAINKIFICDDDRGITEMLEMVFELADYSVVVENNSLYAYDSIKRLQPQVVLVDLWMPVVSGDLLIRKIKSDPSLTNVYVACMSASRDGEQVAMDAGADIFIAKPFDLDQIMSIVGGVSV